MRCARSTASLSTRLSISAPTTACCHPLVDRRARDCLVFWAVHPNLAPTVVLVHGAWADGSSWSRVITGLQQAGINVTAAPIPLTTLDDDINAVTRAIHRTEGPVVLAGHAYAGGVVGAVSHPRIK